MHDAFITNKMALSLDQLIIIYCGNIYVQFVKRVIWYLNIGHTAGGFKATLAATVSLCLHLLYNALGSGSLKVHFTSMVFQGCVAKAYTKNQDYFFFLSDEEE